MTTHKVQRLPKVICRSAKSIMTLAATLAYMLFAACSTTEEPETPVIEEPAAPLLPEGKTFLSVIVQSTGGKSRTDWEGPTWGDFYTEETADALFERRVDPSRVHVVVFDSEGKPVLNLNTLTEGSDVVVNTISDDEGLYQIFFDISNIELTKGEEYIAAIYANYSGSISPNQVDNIYFTLDNLVGSTGGSDPTDYYRGRMPMFGFIHWTFGNYADPENIYEVPVIGTIELLRAVCKIEVRLGDPAQYPKTKYMSISLDKAPRLAYVKGRHINTRGHYAPAKSTWMDPMKHTTRDLTFQDSFFELIGNRWTSETSEHLHFPARSADARSFYIYLPEASGYGMAPNFDALRLNVTVTYDDPADGIPARTVTGTLFPSLYYDDENQAYPAYTKYNRWKLVRNHIYRFTITDLANETNLKYDVSVAGEQVVNVPTFD